MSKFNKLRKRIYEIIGPSTKGDVLSIIYDIFICTLVILSSTSVFIELANISEVLNRYLQIFEYVVVGFFIFDYLLHIFVCDFIYPECKNYAAALKEYVTSFDSFIDLLSILSVLLNQIPKGFAALRLIKLVKLVRLVKLSDYFGKKEKKGPTFFEKAEKRIHEIVTKDTTGDKLSKTYDIFSFSIIVLSVVLLVLDTFDFSDGFENALYIIEIVIASLFALEYLVRVWIAPLDHPDMRPDKARMKYIFSFMAVIDLLSIIPVFIAGIDSATAILKVFKLTKILRLVKASRYLSGLVMFGDAIKKKFKAIVFSVVILAFVIVLSSMLMYGFEHEAQPEVFKNGFSGLAYSLVNLAGMGESDIEPVTTAGTVLQILMTILGACIVGVPLAIVADEFSSMVFKKSGVDDEEDDKKDKDDKDDKDDDDDDDDDDDEITYEKVKRLYDSLSEEDKELFAKALEENDD